MFQTIIANVITAVLIAGVTWLIGKIGLFINSIITKNKLEIDTKTVDSIMTSFKTALTQAIIATNQTYVNDLKKNGQFDEKAMKKAMKTTIDNCKKMLGNDVLNYLENTYADLEGLIEATAETIIGASKSSANIDTQQVVDTIVSYMSKLPDSQKYSMEEIVAELRAKFNITAE